MRLFKSSPVDIDCRGHENKTTLEDKRNMHKEEISIVESIQSRVDILEGKGLT